MKGLVIVVALFLLNVDSCSAQEWKRLKLYKNETGNAVLKEGCWLKKDRKKQTKVWKDANLFNLSIETGFQKYTSISQIRDFYLWFDLEREKLGHEINWIGIAALATRQLSYLDSGFVRFLFVRNKEVVKFANDGTKKVFEFAYPKLREVYYQTTILKGIAAKNWDASYGMDEQCLILEPLYKKFSPTAFHKLDRMAKGKGFFYFGTPKLLKFEGSLRDCENRLNHGIDKLLPYYLSNKQVESFTDN